MPSRLAKKVAPRSSSPEVESDRELERQEEEEHETGPRRTGRKRTQRVLQPSRTESAKRPRTTKDLLSSDPPEEDEPVSSQSSSSSRKRPAEVEEKQAEEEEEENDHEEDEEEEDDNDEEFGRKTSKRTTVSTPRRAKTTTTPLVRKSRKVTTSSPSKATTSKATPRKVSNAADEDADVAPSPAKRVSSSSSSKKLLAEGDGGDDDDGEEDFIRTVPSHRTRTPSSASKAAVEADLQQLPEDGLFASIAHEGTALKTTVRDWVSQYRDNANLAIAQFISFVVQSAGFNITVTEEQIEMASFEELQEQLHKEKASTNYPLVSREKKMKKFRKSFDVFLYNFVEQIRQSLLSTDSNLLKILIDWLTQLSNSDLRSLRHAATLTALVLGSAMATSSRQLRTEIVASKSPRSRSNNDLALLEQASEDILSGVFMLRYLDVFHLIRADCIRELGKWLVTNEEMLKNDTSKYLGWALSDQEAEVRLEALNALHQLYDDSGCASRLDKFTLRFKDRMVDMLLDIDSIVCVAAAAVVHQLADLDQLDAIALSKISDVVVDSEIRLRTAVAQTVFKHILEPSINRNMQDQRIDATTAAIRQIVLHLHAKKLTSQTQIAHWMDTFWQVIVVPPSTSPSKSKSSLTSNVLQNWTRMADLLREDARKVGTLTNTASRRTSSSSSQQQSQSQRAQDQSVKNAILSTMLTVSVTKLINEGTDDTGMQKKQTESKKQLQSEMTQYFGVHLPELFRQFATEPSTLLPLVTLPTKLDLNALAETESMVDNLISTFGVLVQQQSHRELLQRVGSTISECAHHAALKEETIAKLITVTDALISDLKKYTSNVQNISEDDDDGVHADNLTALEATIRRLHVVADSFDITNGILQRIHDLLKVAGDVFDAMEREHQTPLVKEITSEAVLLSNILFNRLMNTLHSQAHKLKKTSASVREMQTQRDRLLNQYETFMQSDTNIDLAILAFQTMCDMLTVFPNSFEEDAPQDAPTGKSKKSKQDKRQKKRAGAGRGKSKALVDDDEDEEEEKEEEEEEEHENEEQADTETKAISPLVFDVSEELFEKLFDFVFKIIDSDETNDQQKADVCASLAQTVYSKCSNPVRFKDLLLLAGTDNPLAEKVIGSAASQVAVMFGDNAPQQVYLPALISSCSTYIDGTTSNLEHVKPLVQIIRGLAKSADKTSRSTDNTPAGGLSQPTLQEFYSSLIQFAKQAFEAANDEQCEKRVVNCFQLLMSLVAKDEAEFVSKTLEEIQAPEALSVKVIKTRSKHIKT